jgi:hypothetical protein
LGYAQYDLVHVFNELMDALHAGESAVEKILAGVIRVPASRFLRMKRQVSFLISDGEGTSASRIVQGTYQSPILVQWQRADQQVRRLDVTITIPEEVLKTSFARLLKGPDAGGARCEVRGVLALAAAPREPRHARWAFS